MSQATGCHGFAFFHQGQPGLHNPADAGSARETRAAGDAQEEKADGGDGGRRERGGDMGIYGYPGIIRIC